MRILTVDDEMEVLTLVKDVLETVGHTVDIAIDGEMGLEKLADAPYDLILMDHRMHGENGLSISKKIIEKDETAKIVFVSADASVKKEALRMGAVGFLLKPFNVDVLIKEIEKRGKE
ncbi:MAG: response regulator [Euryarchaeota archaeon]|nr:response regulator [Euryarchaeota archaeon]